MGEDGLGRVLRTAGIKAAPVGQDRRDHPLIHTDGNHQRPTHTVSLHTNGPGSEAPGLSFVAVAATLPVGMLRLGYTLLVGSVLLLFGYGGYELVRALWRIPGVPPFLKWVILLGALGLVLTLAGLIWERLKEGRDARGDG